MSNEYLINVFSSEEFSYSRKAHPKKISSGVDNWYLDEFFEEFICGR
jgi:hypothetical protein